MNAAEMKNKWACNYCGTWKCNDCDKKRYYASRFVSFNQSCRECGSKNGVMLTMVHEVLWRQKSHVDMSDAMRMFGRSPRYPLPVENKVRFRLVEHFPAEDESGNDGAYFVQNAEPMSLNEAKAFLEQLGSPLPKKKSEWSE